MKATKRSLFDIAANLADDRFIPDLKNVLKRAKDYNVNKLLLGGTYLEDSKRSYEISLMDENYYCTVGIHPCRAAQYVLDKKTFEEYALETEKLIQNCKKGKIVAIGECGLDYDRFSFAGKDFQLKFVPHFYLSGCRAFPIHFDWAKKYNLPMYLHERSSNGDFSKLVKENRGKFTTGVVHSFTGEPELMKELVGMDLFIGVTGCSLKTQANMDMVKQIPLDRILLETDSPYCTIRPSFPSFKMVKTQFKPAPKCQKVTEADTILRNRNEPCAIVQVLEVVAALKGISDDELAKASWDNSLRVFGIPAAPAI
ncbi:MAG: TatD family hydrolase [Candidatus Pacebacteria bacterium]|nr:TatD family hydrolase [Candidatus Paceibacterota bacterium]